MYKGLQNKPYICVHWSVTQRVMTRQLCVYIKRARGNTQKSIHGKTSEKRACSLNTQKKYIPAGAIRQENTSTRLRLGSWGKNFAGISKFLGVYNIFYRRNST